MSMLIPLVLAPVRAVQLVWHIALFLTVEVVLPGLALLWQLVCLALFAAVEGLGLPAFLLLWAVLLTLVAFGGLLAATVAGGVGLTLATLHAAVDAPVGVVVTAVAGAVLALAALLMGRQAPPEERAGALVGLSDWDIV